MKRNKKELLDINKRFYEDFGESFSSKRFFEWNSFIKLKRYIENNDRVLDIGSGNGRFSEFVNPLHYIGIDFSSTLISIAQKRYPDHTFLELDITDINWYKNLDTFDKIFLIAVLHHIPEYENRLILFKDIRNIVKKNGLFIFSIWRFNDKNITETISNSDYLLSWDKVPDLRYVHKFDKQEIDSLIKESGFILKDSFSLEQNEYFILV